MLPSKTNSTTLTANIQKKQIIMQKNSRIMMRRFPACEIQKKFTRRVMMAGTSAEIQMIQGACHLLGNGPHSEVILPHHKKGHERHANTKAYLARSDGSLICGSADV